jgi:hypothetical protein
MNKLLTFLSSNQIKFSIDVFLKLDHEIYRDGSFSFFDRLTFTPLDFTNQWLRVRFSSDEDFDPEDPIDLFVSIDCLPNLFPNVVQFKSEE